MKLRLSLVRSVRLPLAIWVILLQSQHYLFSAAQGGKRWLISPIHRLDAAESF